MVKKNLIGADYLLLLLHLNDREPIKGSTRLTKMMFLFNEEIAPLLKNINKDKLPDFFPFDYGPFSKDLYEQIELFKNIKFIKLTNMNSMEDMDEADDWEESPYIDELYQQELYINEKEINSFFKNIDGKFIKYSIAPLGNNFVEHDIKPHIIQEQLELLRKFKSKITTIPIKQLLYYVYSKYPEYTEKSKIKEDVLG